MSRVTFADCCNGGILIVMFCSCKSSLWMDDVMLFDVYDSLLNEFTFLRELARNIQIQIQIMCALQPHPINWLDFAQLFVIYSRALINIAIINTETWKLKRIGCSVAMNRLTWSGGKMNDVCSNSAIEHNNLCEKKTERKKENIRYNAM